MNPKPGEDNTDPSYYRPIVFTSFPCKTLERMIYAGRERLPFSSTWFHPQIIKEFDLFSEGPLSCLCTVSLTDLVHSYLELRD